MPQPVKLSDTLVDAAREAAEQADRSIAGQIEHWARVGRAVSDVLTPADTARVASGVGRAVPTSADDERAALLQAIRLAVSRNGHTRLGAVLRATGRTHYGTNPALPGCLVRIAPDGTHTPGHLVNRRFVPLTDSATVSIA
jgi:hypothetical protein